MNTLHRALLAGLLTSLSLSTAWADMAYQQQQAQQQYQSQYDQPRERSYGEKIGKKALNGVVNLHTGVLELPKSIIKNTNAEGSNIFFGLVGGTIEGSLNMAGRTVNGAIDLATFLIPTTAVVQMPYVWEDFYEARTIYGDVFRFDDDQHEPVFRLPNGR